VPCHQKLPADWIIMFKAFDMHMDLNSATAGMERCEAVNVIKAQSKQVQDGDLSGLEAMPVGQATAL
jgi:hypothetical protein